MSLAGIIICDEDFDKKLRNSKLNLYDVVRKWGGPYIR
jgi:predicted SpoU family rRNA methylase